MKQPPPSWPRRSWVLAALGLGVLALLAAGAAVWLRPAQRPPAARVPPAAPQAQLEAMLQQLRARTVEQPQDAQGWAQLARAQAAVGRLPEATAAFRQALALRPDDADLLADTADVLAVQQGRTLEGEPLRLLERALQANPRHAKSLALWGKAALDRQDRAEALRAWQHAVQVLPPADPLAIELRARIAQLQAPAPR
ncbi:MAG: hypothetical protein AB1430_24975 [Pseudomonadota bacterium]